MKWIYVGLVNNEPIAFHDDKHIMSRYLRNYKETNPKDIVCMGKLKRKRAKENPHYRGYWLVSCNDTYVQTEYEDTLLMLTPEYYGREELLDKLNHLLAKTKKMDDKLVLIDTIRIIESNKKRYGSYTPSISILNEEYWKIQEYKDKITYYL